MEKRTPTYDLASFKDAAAHMAVTTTALQGAQGLGIGRKGMTVVIQTMERRHFYKSMTSYTNHREWQDVYHVPHGDLVLYVKFVADVVAEFRLLSFKEK
mgnify:CR=1 FL=1